MITPLITRCFRPIIGSLRSLSANSSKHSRRRGSKSGDGPHPRAFFLEDKNPRRGRGPRSVNPLPTTFSGDGSDEHINAIRQDEMEMGYGSGAAAYDTDRDRDLEAGHGTAASLPVSRCGVIVKQTSLEIIETRQSGELLDEREIGDYYLVRQSQRDAERLARKVSVGRKRRSSATLGMGRAV
jgi:hypothetical protein